MSPFSRIRAEHLVVVGSVLLMFTATLILAQRPHHLGHDPKNEKQGSSHFTTPGGGKALYVLLDSLGFRVARHERAVELLPAGTRELVLLAPRKTPAENEILWIRDWVTRGGTLVWAPRVGIGEDVDDPVAAAFGLKLRPAGGEGLSEMRVSLRTLDRREESTYSISVRRLQRLESDGTLPVPVPLAQDDEGWVAAVAKRGEGRVVAIADPGLCDNQGLPRADNAEFMVRMASLLSGDAPIVFEEFHHGFAEGQSAFAVVLDSSLGPVVWIAVAAGFCGIFATGRRLGPALDLHPERRRKPAEFVDAFAGLCRRMKAGPQALSMVLAEFRLHLQHAYGAATPEDIGRIAGRAGLDAAAVLDVLDRAQKVASGAVLDDGALVSLCREIEGLRRSLRNSLVARKSP